MRGRSLALAFSVSLGVLFLLGVLLYRWKEREGCFSLEAFRLWGCRKADSTAIASVLSPLFGMPLGRMDIEAVEHALEALPGVERASAWREWPDAAGVSLELSRPVVAFVIGGCPTAISSTGEELPATFLSDTLPVVGLAVAPDPGVLRNVVAWAACGGARGAVDSLYIDESGLVALESGMKLVLGREDFSGRLRAWRAVSGCIALSGGWEEADMRFDGQVVLRGDGFCNGGP